MILLVLLIVTSQGMAIPVGRHQDPAQVGMAHEVNAKEVVSFAFVPVSSAPNVR
jgi:hypothetical protein